jgi:threonine/homoserine/homoserine lactone efflux protein
MISLAGFTISLCGTLPLGTLNVMTMQIALTQNNYKACLFAAGVVVVEMAYLFLTLYAAGWMQRQQKLLFYADWFTVVLFVTIAVNAFYKVFYYSPAQNVSAITETHFLKGALLNSINPAQLSFWLGWNTTLFSKKLLSRNTKLYLSYVTGAGLGGFAGLVIFIITAGILQHNFVLHQKYIGMAVAVVFIICALIQVYRNLSGKRQYPTNNEWPA